MKRGRLEMVYWVDAHFDKDYVRPRKTFTMRTVGWARKQGPWLTVVGEVDPDGQQRGITRIPLVNVIKRRRLH